MPELAELTWIPRSQNEDQAAQIARRAIRW